MNFKEWMKLSEVKSSVRYKPPGGSLNTGYLRGSAATFGHLDSPTPIEKGVTAAVSGIGASIRGSLENDTGLVVRGVGRILEPPAPEEEPNAHYNFLPLQLPEYIYNKRRVPARINLGSNRMYRDIMSLKDANVRTVDGQYGMDKGVEVEGAYVLLKKDEETGELNGDYTKAKQFTTALIYRMILEAKLSSKEKDKYDLNALPEVIGEEVSPEGVLLVWFQLPTKDLPQEMEGGRPKQKS